MGAFCSIDDCERTGVYQDIRQTWFCEYHWDNRPEEILRRNSAWIARLGEVTVLLHSENSPHLSTAMKMQEGFTLGDPAILDESLGEVEGIKSTRTDGEKSLLDLVRQILQFRDRGKNRK
jgi:hypothetical protein